METPAAKPLASAQERSSASRWTQTSAERRPTVGAAALATASPRPVPEETRIATSAAAGGPASGGGVTRRVLVGVATLCLLAGGGAAALVTSTSGGDTTRGDTADGETAPGDTAGGVTAAPIAPPTDGVDDAEPTREAASDDGVPEAGRAAPSAQPTATTAPGATEEQAVRQLGALRSAALQTVVLDGRWVAQVASKSIGITDPLQVAQNGTHTFYAVDILAESEAAVHAAGASKVLVLTSLDFGKRSAAADGQPYWVTLVDGNFGSAGAVNAWCAQTYAMLSPAELANACAPRTLSPSHD
ncbi:hypothetical protein [Blastococcus sp. SYSU DS0617]